MLFHFMMELYAWNKKIGRSTDGGGSSLKFFKNNKPQSRLAWHDNCYWVSGRSVDLYVLHGTTHTSIC